MVEVDVDSLVKSTASTNGFLKFKKWYMRMEVFSITGEKLYRRVLDTVRIVDKYRLKSDYESRSGVILVNTCTINFRVESKGHGSVIHVKSRDFVNHKRYSEALKLEDEFLTCLRCVADKDLLDKPLIVLERSPDKRSFSKEKIFILLIAAIAISTLSLALFFLFS